MTSPTKKPTYDPTDLDYDDLAGSHFGNLLAENSAVLTDFHTIRVLTEQCARELWRNSFGDVKHKAAIPGDNWCSSCAWTTTGEWLEHYNSARSNPVERQLRQLVDWRDEQLVLFFRGPLDCVVSTWQAFVENWLTFFEYDDDGPFIVPVDREEVLRICPNGTFMKGVPNPDG